MPNSAATSSHETTITTSPQQAFIWHRENLATATQGTWQQGFSQNISSQCICTDTRKLKAGDVFLAIKGDNFDGHSYLVKAKDLGAVAAIVSDPQDTDLPQLVVANTKLALGHLGKYVRASLPHLKVVALTGSSGKTTTKEMLGSILNRLAPTLITKGNLNNDLGVPMMLLELTQAHQYAVLELGANHVGEIAYTANMVQPQVACVLNIGTAHLGEFGGRDNICTAKAEIFSALTGADTAVIPAEDDYSSTLHQAAASFTSRIVQFGKEVRAENVYTAALGSEFELHIGSQPAHKVTLAFAGEHNVSNALAAAACAYQLGVSAKDIATGLCHAKAPKGRLTHIAYHQHSIIDDTYNANPDATLAAAAVLVKTAQEKAAKQAVQTKAIMVLGDIGELGAAATAEHQKLGEKLATKGIDQLYAVGDLMAHCVQAAAKAGLAAEHFTEKQQLAAQLTEQMAQAQKQNQSLVMLFKGSRFMAIESIIADITQS